MAFGDARRHGRKRCQMMKVIRLVETRNLASVPSAGCRDRNRVAAIQLRGA